MAVGESVWMGTEFQLFNDNKKLQLSKPLLFRCTSSTDGPCAKHFVTDGLDFIDGSVQVSLCNKAVQHSN
jgi:hypothetical protein